MKRGLFHSGLQQSQFFHYTFPIVAAFVENGLELFLFAAALNGMLVDWGVLGEVGNRSL